MNTESPRRWLWLMVLASLLSACAGSHEARVVHVVLVWLNEPGNSDHKAQVIAATRAFGTIDGVEEIRVGAPVPSARAVVDDSFDVGLYIVFSSRAALDAYLADPAHKAAQRDILRSLSSKVVIYDFFDDGESR